MANLSSTRIFGDGTVERSLYVKQRLGVGVGNPDNKIHVQSPQEAILKLEADTDNSDETDHAQVQFSQDDGAVTGFLGYANGNNALRLENTYSDSLKLATNGNERVRIESGGNVGIGTTSPNQKLDVEGAADLNGRLNMRSNNITNVNNIRVDNGSIIGINGGPEIEFEGNGIEIQGNTSVSFGDQQGKDGLDMQGREIHFADQASIGLDGNGVNVEIQDGSGSRGQLELFDVYIGESNTWVDDHIGNDDAHHPDHRDGVDYIDFDNDERSDHDGQDGRLYWDLSEGLYISSSNSRTGSSSVLQWSRSNVNPGSNISISYDSRGRPTIAASSGNTYTDSDARDAILNNTLSLGEGFRFHDNTSNLNTGTLPGNDYRVLRIEDSNSPNSPDGAFVLTSGDDDAIIQEWFDVGTEIHTDLYVRQDVIAYYSSDRRLKNDPTQIQNPLSEISKLTGVGFNWKENASRNGSGFGVFAQDVKKIDERLVRKQGDGYLGVDYQQLHAFEIEALKQVNEKVEENQSEIQRLKQRIAKLESNDNAI